MIWSGKGALVPVIFVLCFVSLTFILGSPETIFATWSLILGPCLLITAIFSWWMGKKWNKPEILVMVEENKRKEYTLIPNHSFCWIRMEHWGAVLGTIGILVMVTQFV